MAEIIVPVAGIFFTIGLPILAFVFFRVLKHRERMAMIERGFDPTWKRGVPPMGGAVPPARGQLSDDPTATLRRGITLTAVGLALTVGLSVAGIKTEPMGGVAVPGIDMITVWKPGPSLLLGLVPLFVGLAQILTATLAGATLGTTGGSARGSERGSVPPPFPEAPFPGRTTFDGPYAYRPDGTTELRPPTAPPERR